MTTEPAPRAVPTPDELLEPLAVVVRGHYDDLTAVAARHGLSTSQARALIALGEPMPMSALATHLVCDASNATGLIGRMEARGLVTRTPAPGDRRSKVASRTAEGTELAHRIRAEMRVVHGALEALTPEERTALLPLLDRLGRLLSS
ncbi:MULTISPECIES: MarR family winged helix-turn-helix transcriptional regulator [unclassified Streptomyces]|uniref:MarR family winged helix-turn-helix transcriptional regulator n=1 Tax=unclassified Streptomyces TaxID=2593676 RepID=UPI00093EFA69|nr:MarR family transcriptional regulator [Streptomyces sp. CB02058]OKI87474.1 MarR family transcriptional regulator [Streptomyces sp. CB02058]